MTASTIDVSSLRATYEAAGQGHVFKFWDQLSTEEQAAFAAQLESIDVERVNRIYRNAVAAEAPVTPLVEDVQGETPETLSAPHLLGLDRSRSPSPRPVETVTPLPESACASVLDNAEDEARWRDIGLKAIADGTVAVLLMAGGQGTRLGSSHPKGMYNISLPSNRTLFQYQAARIKSLEALAAAKAGKNPQDVAIRWYVMTSGPTRPETEAYFAKNSFFGLNPANVVFFEQGEYLQSGEQWTACSERRAASTEQRAASGVPHFCLRVETSARTN